MLINSARLRGILVKPVNCTGLMDKIPSLLNAITSLNPDDLLFVSDGYDAVYTNESVNLKELILSFDADIVFSCSEHPDHHLVDYRTISLRKYPAGERAFLCSGCLAGRVGAVKAMLREILKHYCDLSESQVKSDADFIGFYNDQTCFGLYAVNHPDLVCIDDKRLLSATVCYRDDEMISAVEAGDYVRMFAGATGGALPCLIHVPTTSALSYSALVFTTLALNGGCTCLQIDVRRVRASVLFSRRTGVTASDHGRCNSAELVWQKVKNLKFFWIGLVLSVVRFRISRLRVFGGRLKTNLSRWSKTVASIEKE